MHAGMTRIGDECAVCAEFPAEEGILVVRQDVGGESARCVDFDPVLGGPGAVMLAEKWHLPRNPISQPAAHGGDLEPF